MYAIYINIYAHRNDQGIDWFDGESRTLSLSLSFAEAAFQNCEPWGKIRRVVMKNVLFGGKFPKFFGFDYGPVFLPGNRATIVQGAIYESHGRITTFCPSYR